MICKSNLWVHTYYRKVLLLFWFSDSPSFEVKIGKSVSLQCQDNATPEDYDMLPFLTMPKSYSSEERISMKNCPLPTTRFTNIVSKLGIKNLKALMFEANGNNLSDTLNTSHFQGAEGLTYLVLNNNGLTDLPEDIFSYMKNLTVLNLRMNKLHLPPNIFEHVTKLNTLELGQNKISILPDGLFKHLKVLKQLNLWQNNLSYLNSKVFDGLESLEELDLNSNKLENLSSDVFSKLPNLKVINLFTNNFTSLPEGLFGSNPRLKKIRLFDNKQSLKTLPEGLLSNKINLTEVKLNGCKISYLPESLLWSSQGIQLLHLNRNNLTVIPSNLLRDQVNLTDLDLSDNLLTKIPDDSFRSLKKLKYLRIDRNQLVELSGWVINNYYPFWKLFFSLNFDGRVFQKSANKFHFYKTF